jgi:hypothetical protein
MSDTAIADTAGPRWTWVIPAGQPGSGGRTIAVPA